MLFLGGVHVNMDIYGHVLIVMFSPRHARSSRFHAIAASRRHATGKTPS
jgi:hypothetical protein